MNLNLNLLSGLGGAMSKMGTFLRFNSPRIMLGVGIASGVAGGVMACAATLKAQTVVEEAKEEIEQVRENKENADEDTVKRELIKTYMHAGKDLAVLYLPSIGMGILSVAAILSGHRIMTKRNAALAAAYSVLESTFKGYRERVADRFGNGVERELRYGLTETTIEDEVTDKNGKVKKVARKALVAGIDGVSDYARLISRYDPSKPNEGSLIWEVTKDFMMYQIGCVESYANNILQANGYLFLNDVYKELGLPDSLAGQVVGWVYDRNDPNGDNKIIFTRIETVSDNGDGTYDDNILLDFNVDGPILELAKEKNLITA